MGECDFRSSDRRWFDFGVLGAGMARSFKGPDFWGRRDAGVAQHGQRR